eukprot:scaffold3571_cov176-Amphora_coffeaeformis.AAC.12
MILQVALRKSAYAKFSRRASVVEHVRSSKHMGKAVADDIVAIRQTIVEIGVRHGLVAHPFRHGVPQAIPTCGWHDATAPEVERTAFGQIVRIRSVYRAPLDGAAEGEVVSTPRVIRPNVAVGRERTGEIRRDNDRHFVPEALGHQFVTEQGQRLVQSGELGTNTLLHGIVMIPSAVTSVKEIPINAAIATRLHQAGDHGYLVGWIAIVSNVPRRTKRRACKGRCEATGLGNARHQMFRPGFTVETGTVRIADFRVRAVVELGNVIEHFRDVIGVVSSSFVKPRRTRTLHGQGDGRITFARWRDGDRRIVNRKRIGRITFVSQYFSQTSQHARARGIGIRIHRLGFILHHVVRKQLRPRHGVVVSLVHGSRVDDARVGEKGQFAGVVQLLQYGQFVVQGEFRTRLRHTALGWIHRDFQGALGLSQG